MLETCPKQLKQSLLPSQSMLFPQILLISKELASKGVKLFAQMVPSDKAENFMSLLER